MRYDGILIMANLPQLKADKMAGKSKKTKVQGSAITILTGKE
jgi:hypothetical protein